MDVCRECCVFSGRGLCDGPITWQEGSYWLWCVVVCDLETSWMRRPWPTGGGFVAPKTNKSNRRDVALFGLGGGNQRLHKSTTLGTAREVTSRLCWRYFLSNTQLEPLKTPCPGCRHSCVMSIFGHVVFTLELIIGLLEPLYGKGARWLARHTKWCMFSGGSLS